MQQELINQAMAMFDTSEKWSAFLELSSLKENIKNHWYEKLKKSVTKKFLNEEVIDGWEFKPLSNQDFRWYLADFGCESLCLRTCNWVDLGLWAPYNKTQIMAKLLKMSKYSIIMDRLRPDRQFVPNDWFLQEEGNFNFGSPYDTHFTADDLSWFAGNETEKLTDQLVEKINLFRKDELITSLIAEINYEAKI